MIEPDFPAKLTFSRAWLAGSIAALVMLAGVLAAGVLVQAA